VGQRAALYCRVSTADQSCDRQERDLRAFAKRSGFEIVGVYKEKASGAKTDRIERKKVMALAQAREIDAILVTELSRWGRSTIDLVQTLQSLQAWDVSVLAVSGLQFDLSTPHGKMIASVMAALAEFERDLIRERIKSGIAAAKARGKRLGRQSGQRPSDRKAKKVLKLAEGWSELPVDRPPCRAQQEHGRSNPATRACCESKCNRPEDSDVLSDMRVSAARGARNEPRQLRRTAEMGGFRSVRFSALSRNADIVLRALMAATARRDPRYRPQGDSSSTEVADRGYKPVARSAHKT
jgi:putative DNA-invertase from lambdoid prophage Rac